MKTPDHLGFIAIGEYSRDQRDAFVQAKRTSDQALPRWNAAAVRVANKDVYARS